MAKDERSTYLARGPSRAWLKVKVRQEGRFVVAGVLVEDERRFAGVVVAEREGDALTYRGAVEYGFRRGELVALLTEARPLVRSTSPFGGRVPLEILHHRHVIWLEPRLSAEVAFAEVMQGRLRDPVFRQLVAA